MPQSVVAITPTAVTFTAGTGSAGEVLTTFLATMSPPTPTFAGVWSLSGADAARFLLNSSTGLLTVGASDVAVGNYNVIVTATP